MSTNQPPATGTGSITPAATPKRTILVVEDEDTIRSILRTVMKSQGFNVLVAGSGAEALRQSQDHEGSIDLVITDMLMPGMNGSELVRLLLPTRPAIHVIFISGYPGPEATLPPGGTGKMAFVGKPFTPNELVAVVRGMLD
jgi:CheY-like chemotaxis protein